MLGIVAPPTIPPQSGGIETILAIVSSVVLLVGVAIWLRIMARQTKRETGVTIEFPAPSTKAA